MRLPALRLPALLLPALAACAAPAGVKPCPEGSSRRASDGLCVLDSGAPSGADGGADGGGGGADGGGDGADGGADGGGGGELTLPALCEAPAGLGPDPVQLVGEIDLQRHVFAEVVDLEVDADRGVVIAAGQGGLMSIDVSDPAAPAFLGAARPTSLPDRLYRVELGDDGIVWTTHRDTGLYVFDTSDPRNMLEVGRVSLEGLSGMARDGDRLYVTRHTGTLEVFDVSDPRAPRPTGALTGLGNPWEPLRVGDRLYIADNTLGVVVVDVSSPDAPRLVATVGAAGGVQDLAISADGRALYAAVGGAGLQIFDLADPALPAAVGLIPLGASVQSVAVDGGQLWAVNQAEVIALDLADPLAPVVLNAHRTPHFAMHVAASGGRAHVGDWGFLRLYTAGGAAAPSLDPAVDRVYIPEEGGVYDIPLHNRGGTELVLTGLTLTGEGLSATVDADRLPPGGEGRVRLVAAGGAPVSGALCLASTDPEQPVQTVELLSRDGDDVALGAAAPDFELAVLGGGTVRLSDQEGVPVVLVYFATW
jgi:hypothetical protein